MKVKVLVSVDFTLDFHGNIVYMSCAFEIPVIHNIFDRFAVMVATRGVGGEGWLPFASGEELILPMSNKIRNGNQEPGNMKKMIPDCRS